MNGRIETTRKLLEALSRSDEAALRAVLTETPAFMALGVNLSGLDNVLGPTGQIDRVLMVRGC